MTWLETAFTHPEFLAMLAGVPLLLLLRRWQRYRLLARFVSMTGGHDLALVNLRRRRWLDRCLVLALILVIIGSAGPRFGRDPQAPPGLGRDIVVVLDISRSMLAEDGRPSNRLARAKDRILNFADSVERRGGYRLALLVFAGQGKVLSHLADDYDAFRFALGEAEPAFFPAAERVGWTGDGSSFGTSIRRALELAVQTHDSDAVGYQEILLVSDGDDLAGDWAEALPTLRSARIPVSVLGVGDPRQDAFIPTGEAQEPFQLYRGQPVRTRRHDEVLRQIAEVTGGEYLTEEQGPLVLVSWFQQSVLRRPEREWFAGRIPVSRPRFAWFFLVALALMIVEMTCSDRRPGVTVAETPKTALAASLAILWGLSVSNSAEYYLHLGNAAYGKGDYASALNHYDAARLRTEDPGLVAFCRGAALYQLRRFDEAEAAYRQSLEDATGWRRAAALYGLGNALAFQAETAPARVAVSWLREAIESYSRCISECAALPAEQVGSLAEDAAHNLQQVQDLLVRKLAEAEREANQPGGSNQPPPDLTQQPGNDPQPNQPSSKQPEPQQPGQSPRVTEQTRPGKGNLPPLLDDLTAPLLSAQQAHDYLRVHLERIQKERTRRRDGGGVAAEGRDW